MSFEGPENVSKHDEHLTNLVRFLKYFLFPFGCPLESIGAPMLSACTLASKLSKSGFNSSSVGSLM